MTEKYRQAVMTFVNCSEKISRAAEAANKNKLQWSLEKMEIANRICEELARQREKAKKIIFDDDIKNEKFTQEEYDWVMEKLKPYIKSNE